MALFRFLCCSCEADLWDWISCFLTAQVRLRRQPISHWVT